jgi:hypothetical protein
MATKNQSGNNSNGWTPEHYIQAFKEIITAALGLLVVIYTVTMAAKVFTYVGEEEKISDAKDILLLVMGLAGVVIGYYFGRVPADARAAQAQEQANTATAQAQQIGADARVNADQLAPIISQMDDSLKTATRKTGGTPPLDQVSVNQVKKIRENLLKVSSSVR